MIFVVNKRNYRGGGEYVGRPSPLGNSYTHLANSIAKIRVATRDDSVKEYEANFDNMLKNNLEAQIAFDRLVNIARKRDLVLICWCAPKRCHADIIKDRIEAKLKEETN